MLGVILAGGAARRMGGEADRPVDKALLDLAGAPMLAWVLERLAAQLPGGRASVMLSANGDPARFAAFGAPVIADAGREGERRGPLAGLAAGLAAAEAAGAEAVVSAAGDTPFLPERLVEAFAAAGSDLVFAADAEGGVHPTFARWPTRLAPELRAALAGGRLRLMDWTRRADAAQAVFDADAFFNVNAPGDLAVARERAARLAAAGKGPIGACG